MADETYTPTLEDLAARIGALENVNESQALSITALEENVGELSADLKATAEALRVAQDDVASLSASAAKDADKPDFYPDEAWFNRVERIMQTYFRGEADR